jgi:hypothetical protein
MPTSEHEDDEVEELYGIIEEIREEDGEGTTNTIIMGDWNSVVGHCWTTWPRNKESQRSNAY